MKLWMVIWMSGQIGGVAGPLPYDAAECLARAADLNGITDARIAEGTDIHGNPLTEEAKSLRAQCVQQKERPEMGSRDRLLGPGDV